MRIVHVHRSDYELGGAEVYVQEISRRQAIEGHHVSLLRVGRDDGIPRSAGVLSGIACVPAAMSRLAVERPDIVHLHGVYGLLSPLVVRAIRRRWPTVLTLHDAAPICFRDSKIIRQSGTFCGRRLGTRCVTSRCHRPLRDKGLIGLYDLAVRLWQLAEYRRLDRVLVSSRYFETEMRRNGFAQARLVHLPMFSRWEPMSTPLPGPPRILFVGRLSREKGAHVLISALARLMTPGWRAMLVGDGPDMTELASLATNLSVRDRVQMRGVVSGEALPELYQNARLVAIPSTGPEAFSLVGVEAMAFGRPVVASAAGGITDWLVDEETGLLVPPGDPQALARAMDRLLQDPDLADRLGRMGARHAEARFQPAQHLARLERVYRDVVTERTPRSMKQAWVTGAGKSA